MKKFFTLAIIAFAGVAMVACGGATEKKSAEELEYEKAFSALEDVLDSAADVVEEATSVVEETVEAEPVKEVVEKATKSAKNEVEKVYNEAKKEAKKVLDEVANQPETKAALELGKAALKTAAALEAIDDDEADDEDLKKAAKAAKAAGDLMKSLF